MPECAIVKRNQRTHRTVSNLQASMLGRRNKTRYKRDNSNALNHAVVQVCINGLKGKMEADSCSTANILEEHSSLPWRIRNLCNQLIPSCMHPLKRNLFPSLVVSMQKLKVSALERKL